MMELIDVLAGLDLTCLREKTLKNKDQNSIE